MGHTIIASNENWTVLEAMFPEGWRELACETGAVVRKLRNFKDTESVMRTLLLHVANGYSLRETVARAKVTHLADVTDVALLKRLQCSENWFKALCLSLMKERGTQVQSVGTTAVQIRIVDGTHVKEPGKTGSQWRIHYSLKLPDLQCDYFKLTPSAGPLTGESFKQYPVKKGDCIIGDRGYSTVQGIGYLAKRGAYSLVRVNSSTLNFYVAQEVEVQSFNLLEAVQTLQDEKRSQAWPVQLQGTDGEMIKGRVCAIRKSQAAADLAIAKLKKDAKKRQREIKPETLEFAKYIIVFTTLPEEGFPGVSVLEWYRIRWQIELVFKRLKSLAGFGHLPKYDDISARAWLYGKLFVGLLTEKLIHSARVISPWGYRCV